MIIVKKKIKRPNGDGWRWIQNTLSLELLGAKVEARNDNWLATGHLTDLMPSIRDRGGAWVREKREMETKSMDKAQELKLLEDDKRAIEQKIEAVKSLYAERDRLVEEIRNKELEIHSERYPLPTDWEWTHSQYSNANGFTARGPDGHDYMMANHKLSCEGDGWINPKVAYAVLQAFFDKLNEGKA